MLHTSKSAKRGLFSSCVLALAMLASTSAFGAGFAIYETDARGFAMGNANVGKSVDAASLYSNPAGITQLPGLQIKAGLSLIQPSVEVSTWGSMDGQVPAGTERTTAMNSYTAVVPNLYATYRITDDIAVGLGVFVPYGLKSDFPQEPISWPGAYNNFMTDIKTFEIAPTFAYRLVHDQPWAKQISVAAGVAALNVDITMKRQMLLGAGPTYSPLTLEGDTWEFGYNLAFQWEVNDQVSFGLVYRSGFDVKITGASASIAPVAGALPSGRSSNQAWGKINLPDSWTFGLNYSPVAPLSIGIAATRTNWSSYDKLTIQAFPDSAVSVSEKDWKDVWRYSIGAEYQANNALALRAGFVIDKDPVNTEHADYMVPSNDRQIYSVGLGWTISKTLTIDFAYAYLKIRNSEYGPRPTDNVLKTFVHTGHANIFSASASFRF